MRSLADFVRLNDRRYPDRDAVVDDERRLSHRQLSHRAWALGRGLLRLGLAHGETVGVLGGNTIFSAETFLASASAGLVHTPYNWRWATPELVFGINDSRARVVLVAKEFAEAIEAAVATGELAHVERIVIEGAELESLLVSGGPPEVTVNPEDIACVLYTGGTTGFPKGVRLSHRAVITNALNEIIDCKIGQTPCDRGMLLTPMFHSAALLCGFLPHYVTGSTSIFLCAFREDDVARLVESERVTDFFIIPNMLRRLQVAGVFESAGFQRHLRAIHTGGATWRMPDKLTAHELLPNVELYFRYGLTEGGPMVTRLQPADVLRPEVDGSIGREYLHVEVQLQNEAGNEVAVGEVGEICVRGPNVMTGYLNRPDATAAVLRDGWLHTGDLAARDENGFLFFRDRSKDMIKSGGENVYSAEIEQLLYAHPAISEAAVVGVPSVEWDEEVRAAVVVRPGHDVDESALKVYLRQNLAGYKIPKVIAFVPGDRMPINPSGKVVKSTLRDLLGWG